MVFVGNALSDARDKALPDPGNTPGTERVAPLIPPVKISHDRNPFGIRGPEGEIGALPASRGQDTASEFFIEPVMTPFIKKMEVLIRKDIQIIQHGFLGIHGKQTSLARFVRSFMG